MERFLVEQHMFTLYQRMVNEIIKQIEGGQLEVGSKLPSELKLGEQFDVSRITVRKALSELEEKGYIVKRQGQGSYVLERSDNDSEFEYFDNPSQEIRKSGYKVTIKLMSFQLIVDGSEGEVRAILGLDKSAYLYKISQIYIADNRPVLYKDTYLPFNNFPMISVNEIQNKEIVVFLANKYDLNSKQLRHEINASIASEEMPHFQELQPNKHEPYIDIFTRGFQKENIVYYSRSTALNDLPMFLVSHKGRNIMTKPHILLTRIDNRLVHGQVGVTWTKTLGANLILVANDEVAAEPLQQKLMKATAESSGAEIRFFSLEKTIQIISRAADRQKIFIVVKTPKDARKLVDGGVPIEELNVGNMHFAPGKKELTKKVYVDQNDKDDLHYLAAKGINVYIEDVPGDHKTEIDS